MRVPIKRQAINEGGLILILPSKLEEAGGLSSLIHNLSSTHKDTPSTPNSQDNKHENKETSSEDTVGGSPVALSYLLEGGVGSILNAGYFLHGVAAAYPPITNDIERIRASHGGLLGLPPLEFVENHPEVVEEIEKIILETYGQKGVEIYHKLCQNASGFYPRQGFEVGREIETLEAKPEANDQQTEKGERTNAPAKENVPEVKENVDNQGNPLNEDGTLKVEKINAIDELTDEDFSNPTRNVQLPALPQNVDNAIGANGKPVVIKKNIFKKNWDAHKFPFNESRTILKSALYNTDLVGQSQPSKKPFHWVAIKLDDKSPIVVLEVNENKDFTEIVGWYTLDERNLGRIKRQAIKNGGELVMLSLKDKVESLSTPNDDLSTHKDIPSTPNSQAKKSKSNVVKKDKAITTSDLFPKVDNSKKLGKEISRQSAVTDKNVTLTRIDYENGYVCRVENKNGDFVEQAYNADGTPMSQALYNIGVDNNQFKEFIKQDKNGLYIKDEQLFEVLMQNTGKENAKPKSDTKKSVPKTKKSLRQHKAEQAQAATTGDTARRDALTDLMQQSGMEVFVDEKAQQVLDEVNGRGAQVRLQAKLSALSKAAKLIHNWIANKARGKIFTIELPEATRRMIRNVMGRDFDSHNITIDGIRHGLKNHGIEGKKLNANSIPIREEDAELIPYIMTAPDYIKKGSEKNGRDSIRFYKTLTNGYIVVIEKEFDYSIDDMETINVWAELSDVTNAHGTLDSTSETITIGRSDAAKIRKDAEDAIRKEEKLREHRVFHGSGAEFDAFDHSHMGEGEGARAYGWGTYVTEVEGIGRAYAKASASKPTYETLYEGDTHGVPESRIETIMEMAFDGYRYGSSPEVLSSAYKSWLKWFKESAERNKDNDWYRNIYEAALKLDPDKFIQRIVSNRNLYTVEIPEDNGTNYLHWEKPLTREQIVRITEKLKSGGWNVVDGNHPTFEKNGERIVLNERAQGQDVYTELEEAFGSDKAASEFLASIGFIGISYPAEYRSGGRNDGARNFVIFNESDAQITDHIRFFRTPGGEAYGFTVNGKIYLDPRIATAETAIHEYAHLWADMLRQMNPEAWNDIVQLMKGTSVWDEVKSLYPELKTDDEIADEVLAHYSGRQGAAKLREEHHRIAHDQNMDLRSKATAIAALERIKQALTKFWKGVADLLHIRFTTAEEVADRVLADLLHGVNPTAYAKREDGKVRKQLIGEKGAAAIDKDEQATARLDNDNTPESTDIDHILGNGNSKQGEKVRQHMETIAQKLGLKLNWVSSNKQSNGFYDPQTKTITIAADAENPLAAVFGHETVHRLKEMNAEAFNSLVALAKEILGSSFEAEVAKIESRYRKAGMNYDTAYYEEEVVCDFVGDMIDNQNLLERVCWDANHKILAALRNVFDSILAAIGIKDARLMHIRTVISAAYEQSVRNDESSKLITGNEVRRDSLKRKDEVDEKSSGYFKKHPDAMSESVFAQAQKDMDDIAEWMNPYYDATAMGNRLLPEEQYDRKGAASTIFANGSYGKTMENTLKCIRTLAYNQFTDDVKKQLGRPLTQRESFLASQMVYDIATDPQCLYCYVSLDRKAYDNFLLKYVQQKEDVLDKFRSLSQDEKSAAAKGAPHTALKELYAEFLANRKDTKNMQARFNMWIRNEMAGNRSVKASDLITAETRRAILEGLDTSLAREVRDAEKYAQSASWAKKDVDYISYVGELLKLSPAWIKKLTGEYGLRFYSFSEYTPAFILENMQMVRDASLRGLNGLGYTKELDFVKIFAPTGMNINCSVYGRMDNEGNMHMDTLQGADWEEVKQLRSKYNNVGAVFVATNDASVDWALNQDWIDVIIPFHIVRTGADIAEFYGWDNHKRDQSDHFADSSKTTYVSPVEHQNDKEKFLEACKKHGLIPRFEKWMNHPNYMRLVNETRLSVNETRPIKPIFDMTEAKDSWDRFVNRGGYYNGWWQVSPEEYANNVRTVVEDIRSGKMANEVEYGRQDMPANPERMIAAARKKRIHGNVPLVDVFDRSGNVLGRKAESSNGAVLYREGENEEDLEAVNARFNERILSLRENPDQKNRIVSLGRPGYILQSGDIADAEIILEYDKFVRKSKERSHLNLLRKYKMGDFCIFVLPQTISYKSPICTKYSAKIQ